MYIIIWRYIQWLTRFLKIASHAALALPSALLAAFPRVTFTLSTLTSALAAATAQMFALLEHLLRSNSLNNTYKSGV